MKKNQDTLFSIKNEELKKERKYSLLFIRLHFIFICLGSLITLVGFIIELSVPNSPLLLVPFLLLCLGLALLYGLWCLQLWIYDILGVLFLFNLWGIFRDPNSIVSGTMLVFLVAVFFAIVSAWRVRSFLKEQKKKLGDQEVKKTTDDSIINQSPENFTEE